MRTRLTLKIEAALVKRAKAFAREHGASVSEIVTAYFASLPHEEMAGFDVNELPPLTRSLLGVCKGSDFKMDDYIAYLEKKYR